MIQMDDEVDVTQSNPRRLRETLKRRTLIQQARQHDQTFRKVAMRHNLGYERLRKYAKCINKGIPMYERDGRPPKLDNESVQAIVVSLQQNGNVETSLIYQLIREENKKTFTRRYPNTLVDKSKVRVSRRTVQRWTEKILNLISQQSLVVV
jgi:transposase